MEIKSHHFGTGLKIIRLAQLHVPERCAKQRGHEQTRHAPNTFKYVHNHQWDDLRGKEI